MLTFIYFPLFLLVPVWNEHGFARGYDVTRSLGKGPRRPVPPSSTFAFEKPVETRPLRCERSRRGALFGLTIGAIISALQPSPCHALSPQEAASDYDSYASTYDELDGGEAATVLGIEAARSQLLSQARGHVLEIGVGTGLNLDKYDPRKIASLTLVDISDGMLHEAKDRLKSLELHLPVKFVKADATSELVDRFGSESFDTVVDTFSLCVFGNEGAKQGLEQLRGVVKDKTAGGKQQRIRSFYNYFFWYIYLL